MFEGTFTIIDVPTIVPAFPPMLKEVISLLGLSSAGVTVIRHEAVKLPSIVVAVIVAEPTPTAVTNPFVETVAALLLLELHETAEFVAVDGATVAVNEYVEPLVIEAEGLLSDTPVTGTD